MFYGPCDVLERFNTRFKMLQSEPEIRLSHLAVSCRANQLQPGEEVDSNNFTGNCSVAVAAEH